MLKLVASPMRSGRRVCATVTTTAVALLRWLLDVAHIGLHGVLLRWIGVDADNWGVLCAAGGVLGALWLRGGGGFDGVAGAAVGGDVAVALEDLLCGDLGGVVKEGGVVENREEILWHLDVVSWKW